MASEFLSEPELLRDYLVGHIEGKSDCAAARVLSRKIANLARQIEVSLAKEGLLILVILPSLKPKAHQSATLFIDPVSIIIRVTENVLLNKTGRSALYIATRVAAILQLHKPPFPWCGEITVTDIRELNIISAKPEEDEDDDYTGWDVIAQTKLSLQPRSTTN